jgi:hypothetical protein
MVVMRFLHICLISSLAVLAPVSAKAVPIQGSITSAITGAYIVNQDGSETDILASLGSFLSFQNANHFGEITGFVHDPYRRLGRLETHTREKIVYENLSNSSLRIVTDFTLFSEIGPFNNGATEGFARFRVAELITFNSGNVGPYNLLYSQHSTNQTSTSSRTFLFDPLETRTFQTDLQIVVSEAPIPASGLMLASLLGGVAFLRRWRRGV